MPTLAEEMKAVGLSQDEIDAAVAGEAETRMEAESLKALAEGGEDGAAAESTAAADAGKGAEGDAEAKATADAAAAKAPADAAAAKAAGEVDAAAVETVDEREAPFAPTLRTEEVKDHSARLKEISVEKAKELGRFNAGEITAEEYAATDDRLQTERDEIVSARTRAQMSASHNEDIQESLFNHELNRFISSSKKEVDYADKAERARFDRALALVASDPDNAGKGMDQVGDLFSQAHRMVLALKGKAPAAAATPAPAVAAATPAAAAAAAPAPRQVPQTLTGMPAAAQADIDNDPLTKIATLEGEELERYIAGLSRTEHDKLMRRSM